MTYLDFINNFRNEIKCVEKYIIGHYEFRTYKKWIFKSGDSIKITRDNLAITINEKQDIVNIDDVLCCCALPTKNWFAISCIDIGITYKLRLK